MGQIVFLFVDIMRCLFRYPIRFGLLVRQIDFIGTKSVPVVIITGGFIGAVFAAQCEFQFRALGMSSAVGPVVAIAMCRELGPVLCALMIAGRVGSAMAAELATMKITEQIDALRALAVYPTEYLIVPRFLAMLISIADPSRPGDFLRRPGRLLHGGACAGRAGHLLLAQHGEVYA